MPRKSPLIALLVGIFALAAFRSDGPFSHDLPLPFNSAVGSFFFEADFAEMAELDEFMHAEMDSVLSSRVLMLNCFAYDSAYPNKVQRMIQSRLPSLGFSEYWEGSAADLSEAIVGHDAVVLAYPTGAASEQLRAYGKVLNQFVRQGGVVLFTGTHEFAALQQLGLFELDYGYYCKERGIHQTLLEHPVFSGVDAEFSEEVYQYPLDISDPNFVTLADVRGYPFMGYKQIGGGKVVYLGLEYYFDEPQSSRILYNALRWALKTRVKRSEVVLYAGKQSPRPNTFDVKIYPNPYYSKATLDVEITKATSMHVEMTDDQGRPVALLLPRRNLSAGFYRFELPNVSPGVYFVQCISNEGKEVRRVVKSERN